MKRTNLPQEALTHKVNSLPDDLRSVAEEMLAEKFGIEEEVVERSAPNPFRDNTQFDARADDATYVSGPRAVDDPRMGYGRRFRNNIRVEVQPWNNGRVAEVDVNAPSIHHLREAIDQFDWENVPKHDRTWLFGPRFWHYLKADPRMASAIVSRNPPRDSWREGIEISIADLYGIPVVVNPNIPAGMLIARF